MDAWSPVQTSLLFQPCRELKHQATRARSKLVLVNICSLFCVEQKRQKSISAGIKYSTVVNGLLKLVGEYRLVLITLHGYRLFSCYEEKYDGNKYRNTPYCQ